MIAAARRLYLLALLGGASLATTTLAQAADTSPWDDDLQSSARLIAAPADEMQADVEDRKQRESLRGRLQSFPSQCQSDGQWKKHQPG